MEPWIIAIFGGLIVILWPGWVRIRSKAQMEGWCTGIKRELMLFEKAKAEILKQQMKGEQNEKEDQEVRK